ncbi:phenylalanine--tRNA ligase subunit alpha [candidate division WOR-3 bacterium]|nr:phenylalanine--tRNA ligase subunit alpha [candidate division WOR-3 bacterium]
MKNKLNIIKKSFQNDFKNADNLDKVKKLEIQYLGKKSELYLFSRSIGSIKDIEEKKIIGKEINILKTEIKNLLKEKSIQYDKQDIKNSIKHDFDITYPVFPKSNGSIHPVKMIQQQLETIFTGMGFSIVNGPEMETDYYNFQALNIPEHHPARDTQDTFWLDNDMLLRTQTSNCQVRAMEKFGAPLKIIAPGKCFRYESMDASHETSFYQMEGLLIDRNISIRHLIGTMKVLLKEIFERDVDIRLRPGYFPFVEPGFELDIKCLICGGKGCKTCKNSGYLELLPCGMVHPNVFKMSKIDPDLYNGFAFGLGLTRLAMMKFNIHDIRYFNSGDLRFLKQFR